MVQTTDYVTELEKKTNFYLGLIRRIDSILESPAKTLITITEEYVERAKEVEKSNSEAVKAGAEDEVEGFPVWMTEHVQPEPRDDLFSKTLCFATIQEISNLQRRFSWLGSTERRALGKLIKQRDNAGHNRLIKNLLLEEYNFQDYVKRLSSSTFGALNPLTASQVFQVLLNDGEAQAHGGLGFLAFFAMIWPLHREFPYSQSFGAAIEPWQPKAYITAKCILPIKTLQNICRERAELLEEIAETLGALKKSTHDDQRNNPHDRWLFNAGLDALSAKLSRLSSIVIDKEALRKCADHIRHMSDETSQADDIVETYIKVCDAVGNALKEVGVEGKRVLEDAKRVLEDIGEEIIDHLLDPQQGKEETHLEKLKLKFAREYMTNPNHRETYLEDLKKAAIKSKDFCEQARKDLYEASDACSNIKDAQIEDIKEAAVKLATANRQVAADMNELVKKATGWCRTVVDREIAHASARNLTDFDPSELVSAIAVAVKWNQMNTTLQVSDALSKALDGAREDGSWSPGQPFYSPNNAMGILPITSDIVCTLTNALEHHPEVEIADDALFHYVDWLERTRTILNFPTRPGTRNQNRENSKKDSIKRNSQTAAGWSSDRLRHPRKIHFPTTAFSINALFKIRNLVEYRLWQLCEKRFTIIRSNDGLQDVDPVDLGAKHEMRLHRHLASIARESQGRNYKDAEYSIVLHGPPGSSKTFIAKALSVEMSKASRPWGSEERPRLVRITPADFTRLGEDRLDSEARLIFDLISGIRGVTVFFDEIDDLLRQRNSGDNNGQPSFMGLVVPAMLNRLADLREACPRQEISFLLATNFVETIEPALIRKGRIDRSYPVVYPDYESRLAIIAKYAGKLRKDKKDVAEIFDGLLSDIASKTSRWPYLSITSACDDLSKDFESAIKQRSEQNVTSKETVDQIVKEWKPKLERLLIDNSAALKKKYKHRLDNNESQELVDEYAHYIICGFRDPSELEKWKGENKENENLFARVTTVLDKECRLGYNKPPQQ